MFNANALLGQLMGGAGAPSAQNRMTHAMGSHGLTGSGSPLSGLLGGLTGGGAGGGGGFGGLADMAQQAIGGVSREVRGNNPLAIGGLGAVAGALLGGRSGAIGTGAMALLGSLAYSALKPKTGDSAPSQEQIAQEAPLGLREPQNQAEEQALEDTAILMIRAMANAAKSDGEVSAEEVFRILGKLQESGADDEARTFVEAELKRPIDVAGMVAQVKSPEVAVEVYAASLLAIEVDTDAERKYLTGLAKALGLDGDVIGRIHAHLGVPPIS